MSDALTALDATFLELEERNEGALMSIGGAMVFEPLPGGGAPSYEQLCEGLASRLQALPHYTMRLSTPHTGGLSWPRWVRDERFDVRNHVTHMALPAPGGAAELCEWLADYFSHRLDRMRPLWEIALVEGLEHGRWAVAQKTHHCMVDGVGSVDVVHLLLDPVPNPSAVPSPSPPAGDGGPRSDGLRAPFEPILQPVVQAGRAGLQAAEGGLHAILHPREALERAGGLARLLVEDEVIAAPNSSINVPIGATRRFAVVNASLAELQAIRAELGGSINDVVLAACTTGLRRLLLARGEKPPEQGLRAMVPVNLREASERLALGNRVSSLFLELPVAEPLAHARHRRIRERSSELKHSGAAEAASAWVDLAALAPPVLHATVARSLYATRLFNVTITNVPGPRIPLYAFGARLREIHPVVPLAAAHAVGIAVISYDGMVTFGVIADSESTPDLGILALGISEGIEELLGLVPKTERPASGLRAPA